MIRSSVSTAVCVAALALASAAPVSAQSWTGPYAGVTLGAGFQREDPSETVAFDTNLDGDFTDTVRTAAGADAFILVNGAGTDLQRTDRFDFHVARVGLSYRF